MPEPWPRQVVAVVAVEAVECPYVATESKSGCKLAIGLLRRGAWHVARCKQLQDDTTIILSLEAAAKFCSPKQLIPKITHFHEADRQTGQASGVEI